MIEGPPRPPLVGGRILPAMILIALGIVFLLGNFFSVGGGALFLGLGVAFLVARVLTGHYGHAVPAGILFGLGGYVALTESGILADPSGGWFFVLLGLSFLAVYAIGARPGVLWPFFPAAALLGFGVVLLGLVDLWPLGDLAWVAAYWPLTLVAIGGWLLVRGRLPQAARRPVATAGILLLVIYAVLAIAATAAAATPVARELGRVQVGVPSLRAPYATTVNLTAPIAPDETLRIVQPNGQTTVRGGRGSEVRVSAAKWFWSREPQVQLTRADGVVTLSIERPDAFALGVAPRTDLAVDVPANVRVDLVGGSGNIELSGIGGPVQIQGGSGNVDLADLSGPVTLRVGSGDVRLANLTGDLRVNTGSGSIRGSGLAHLREATAGSGRITLDGVFRDDAQVTTGSGDVTLRFDPESSVRVAVATSSGRIDFADLALRGVTRDRRSLTGTLGEGSGELRMRTGSGDVHLTTTR
jgi:hypothetical protein